MEPYRLVSRDFEPQPARLLKRGRYGTHIVHFPSLKNGRVIVCESRLEADFALGLEFDRSVSSYLPQPKTIDVAVGSALHSYTCDFEAIHLAAPTKYWEVKPDGVQQNLGLQRLFDAVRTHHESLGNRFEVICNKDIRREPCLGNMKLLYAKAHVVPTRTVMYLRERINGYDGPIHWVVIRTRTN